MSATPDSPGTGVPRVAHDSVQHDLYCVECGYNLRTLPADGVCPECATTIRESMSTIVDQHWLYRLRGGLSWTIRGAAGICLVAVVHMVAVHYHLRALWTPLTILDFAARCLIVFGGLRVAAFSRNLSPDVHALRKVVRVALIISLALCTFRTVLILPGIGLAVTRWLPGLADLFTSRTITWYTVERTVHAVSAFAICFLLLYTGVVLAHRDPQVRKWAYAASVLTVAIAILYQTRAILQEVARDFRVHGWTYLYLLYGGSISSLVLYLPLWVFFCRCRTIANQNKRSRFYRDGDADR